MSPASFLALYLSLDANTPLALASVPDSGERRVLSFPDRVKALSCQLYSTLIIQPMWSEIQYSVSCSAAHLLLIETQIWRMKPHLVYVKNSEATKETRTLAEQQNLAIFHSGKSSWEQETIRLVEWPCCTTFHNIWVELYHIFIPHKSTHYIYCKMSMINRDACNLQLIFMFQISNYL